jgi:Sec-independent protein translocase protein TatA
MFGIGPTELAFFLVIVLLAVGPDRLPTFMRTVGKGLRQVRSASREFKDAIGLDELMRDGDPFRAPPVRPPRERPVPIEDKTPAPSPEATKVASATPPATDEPELEPVTDEPEPAPATDEPARATDEPEPAPEADAPAEAKHS